MLVGINDVVNFEIKIMIVKLFIGVLVIICVVVISRLWSWVLLVNLVGRVLDFILLNMVNWELILFIMRVSVFVIVMMSNNCVFEKIVKL